MTIDQQFNQEDLVKIEQMLLDHSVAELYFKGELYNPDNSRFGSISLSQLGTEELILDDQTIGRLFMIPDGSVVRIQNVDDLGEGPDGVALRSENVFLAEGEENCVIAGREEAGAAAVWVQALLIDRLMLGEQAPERMATVAFGLMAITAYRLGFAHIRLMAAGRGSRYPRKPDDYVGYDVWPKFGFDADVDPAELNRNPIEGLARCRTVQDIRALDAAWWTRHGEGREMVFDLTGNSQSWSILINYLFSTLQEDAS